MRKETLKYYLIAAGFTVCLYLGLAHFSVLANIVNTGRRILSPFILGFALAFILSGPTNWFEKKFQKLKHPFFQKNGRMLAATITLLIAAIAFLFTIFGLIPQLIESTSILIGNMPTYLNDLRKTFDEVMTKVDIPNDVISDTNTAFQNMSKNLVSSLNTIAPDIASTVVSFGTNVVNVFIAVAVATQVLFESDKLVAQCKRLFAAFVPERRQTYLSHVGSTTITLFHNYITVQFISGIVLGILSVIGLYIFGFPYATLIGVFMGVTSMIPVFGTFIGMIPSFFIIVMSDPIKGLWYIVFALVVQQIVGNFVTPNLMTEKLGLPGLWIMVSVTVGGALMGFVGLIIGTPVFAVFYAMLREATQKREMKNKLSSTTPQLKLPEHHQME